MTLLSFHFQIKTILFLLGLALFDSFQEILYFSLNPPNHKEKPPNETGKDSEKNNTIYHVLLVCITFVGEIFCGLLEIIRRKAFKRPSFVPLSIEVKTPENSRNIKLKTTKKDVLLIVLVSCIDFVLISYISSSHRRHKFDYSSIMKIGQIIFLGVLSQFFLSLKLYRHHIVSLIAIAIGIVILSIFSLVLIQERPEKQVHTNNMPHEEPSLILNLILLFLIYLINSFKITTEKYIMHKRYYSPFLLLFLKGSIGLLLFIVIAFCINLLFTCSNNPLLDFICINSAFLNTIGSIISSNFIILFIFFFVSIGMSLVIQLIIQTFNPSYLAIGDSIGGLFIWIMHFLRFNDKPNNSHNHDSRIWYFSLIIGSIIYAIIAFFCLLYTEIIILDCFGLKYYTKGEIEQRAEKESNAISGLLNLSVSDEQASDAEENEI